MGLSLALVASFQWKRRSSKLSMRNRNRNRNRKRRRGDDWVPPEIPLDLQIEILSRLPAKSLMRFKCVSKLWYSLICCRYFSNIRFTVASPQQLPRLYMSLVEHPECNSMEVCHNPGESVLLSLTSSSSSASSFDRDLTIPGMGGRSMVVLRGLILYMVCTRACIYNPTTRQSVTLPAVKSSIFAQKEFRKNVFYFFGHDPVLDQYKVICTVVISSKYLKRLTSEHWVLVLEAGGSWKRIECDQPPHFPTRLGLCINGVIYYLASTSISRDVIFSLDVKSEEFKMIRVPDVVSEFGESLGFIEYGGKPAIFDYTHLREYGLVELWVLEDGGNWSTKSLVLQPCQMHLVNFSNIPLLVHGTTQNGEVILAPMPFVSPFYILYYDLKKNDLRQVQVTGIPDHRSYFYLKLLDHSESIMYLET